MRKRTTSCRGWLGCTTAGGSGAWSGPTLRELALSHLHVHDLCVFAATLAAVTGARVAELTYRLGHATPDLALRYQRPPT